MWFRLTLFYVGPVAAPLHASGKTVPELVLLSSPYRFVIMPLVEHILKVEHDHPDRQIAVLVPELVVKHWWQTPLHNQRAQLLKLLCWCGEISASW
jgi:hypothetical protein